MCRFSRTSFSFGQDHGCNTIIRSLFMSRAMLSRPYHRNQTVTYIEVTGDFDVHQPGGKQRSDLGNLAVAEFAVVPRGVGASGADTIAHIVQRRADRQMIGPHTQRVIAHVADHHPRRDRAVGQFVTHAVPADRAVVSLRELAVGTTQRSNPFPASISGSARDVGPETILQCSAPCVIARTGAILGSVACDRAERGPTTGTRRIKAGIGTGMGPGATIRASHTVVRGPIEKRLAADGADSCYLRHCRCSYSASAVPRALVAPRGFVVL